MRDRSLLHLAMVCPGNNVRLVEIRGGHFMRKRLADLGLTSGDVLSVVQACDHGPMILKVKESRLAIGRGVAHHILVECLGKDDSIEVEEDCAELTQSG